MAEMADQKANKIHQTIPPPPVCRQHVDDSTQPVSCGSPGLSQFFLPLGSRAKTMT